MGPDQGLVDRANYCGRDPLSETTAAGLGARPGQGRQEGPGVVSEEAGPMASLLGRQEGKQSRQAGTSGEAREKSGRTGVRPERCGGGRCLNPSLVRPRGMVGGRRREGEGSKRCGGRFSPGALGRQLFCLCGGVGDRSFQESSNSQIKAPKDK